MKFTAKDLFSDVVNNSEPTPEPAPEPEPESNTNFINDFTNLIHEINELLKNPNVAQAIGRKAQPQANVLTSTPVAQPQPQQKNEVLDMGAVENFLKSDSGKQMIESFLQSDSGKQTIIKILDKLKIEHGDLTISQLEQKIMSGEIKL